MEALKFREMPYMRPDGEALKTSMRTLTEKLRAAANRELDDDGFVRHVCGMPDFSAPGVSPEGQAFYLMMEAAARRLT